MPNTREKLIELLKSGGVRDFPFNAVLADHLIANGVTVTTGISIECKYVDKDGCPQTISRMFHIQTNADRIRAMSDEELANFLADKCLMASYSQLTDAKYNLTATEIEAQKHTAFSILMKWLQKPAQEVK